MPITPHVTSAARRRLRPAALVLGSAALVLGAMTPATAATATTTATTTAARAVLPTTAPRGLVAGVPSASVLGAAGVSAVLPAARSAKKPARVKKPKLVKNGRRHHNVRISWPWVSGATRYVVQASPKKKFKKKTNIRVTRNNPRSRPAGGRVELTVPGLKNATTYRVRVRAIAPNGAKGRWSKVRKARTKVRIPNRITSMTATPGPRPGEVTFRWKHKPKYTKHFRLDLATTTFNPRGKKLPNEGRNHLRIKIGPKKKKYVLSASQAARLGAPAGSGNHIYYRFRAINKNKGEKKIRLLPKLHAVQPAGPRTAAASSTVDARFASYNVAYGGGQKNWNVRARNIARSIAGANIDIVGVQELAPGNSRMNRRPTDQLVDELRSASNRTRDYRITRSTSFSGGSGSQGARIIYDASRFVLLDTCDDSNMSNACVIDMPGPAGEGPRKASYAKFQDLRSQHGPKFWFVSVHLTPDKGKTRRDTLRKRQVEHVVREIEKRNSENLPIVLTGDLNSWQNRDPGNPPHDYLVGQGFVDAFAAPAKTNPDLSTYNQWKTNPKKYGQGFGVRLDYVLVKGGAGVLKHQNVLKPADSDHNLVIADVRLPQRR